MRLRRLAASLALSLSALLPPAPARGAGQPQAMPAGPPFIRLSDDDAAALPARVESESWAVALELAKPKGKAAPVARVRIAAKAGHHLDPSYQAWFKPHASTTVTIDGEWVPLAVTSKKPCPGKPSSSCEVALALPYRPGAKPPMITGFLTFSLCNAEGCQVRRAALSARR
jgi:hypothetical protein